jgi:hypothetical protein
LSPLQLTLTAATNLRQSCLMRMQRKPPRLRDRVTDLPAAAQHDFPKTDIQTVQIGRSLNREFAALSFYISHANKTDIRL